MHLGCKRCVELFDVSDVMSLTNYAVPLVTMDVKSLLDIKEHIYELIDLDIITVDEFLDML